MLVLWWGSNLYISAHQTFDNFLTSEILRSRNPQRAVNLARLKTETYVEIQEKSRLGEPTYRTAVQAIFKDGNQIWLFIKVYFMT